MDDAVWDPTMFSKNLDRLLGGDIAEEFFARWWNWHPAQGVA